VDAVVPQATTRTNLAATLIQMGSEECYTEAIGYLQEALKIHKDLGGTDFHYGATLVALGDAYCFQKEFHKAAKAYAEGMKEIEKHTGRNENYERVRQKYLYALKRNSNLNRCERFYEQFGKSMIHEKFPAYEKRIAVGMVGEGSDCFGFEDDISTDHDYGIGFCMWLTEQDYESIGIELQKEYDKLTGHEGRLKYRRGVMKISDFYNTLLETTIDFETDFTFDYRNVQEEQLATVTNGMVFRDDLGVFSSVREKLLQYYPETIWREKLAQCVHRFSQFAQSNYPRMMARGDVLTAQICIGKAVEITMDMIYLLNRTYAPYYKWKKKGMEKFTIATEILPLLEQVVSLPVQKEAWCEVQYQATLVNTKDSCVKLFEQIAGILLNGAFMVLMSVYFLTSDFCRMLFGTMGTTYFLTAFFAFFIFLGIAVSFNSRTPELFFLSKIQKNKPFIIIMLLVAIIQLMLVYFGGEVFRCTPLSAGDIMKCALFALSVIPFGALVKLPMKNRKNDL
jgi:tetratricopeptide (TPR) repeat protein